MRQLLEAGVHFGHNTRRWDPRMEPYIYGVRNAIHIIDLQQTVPLLHNALVFLYEIARHTWMKGLSGQAPSPKLARAKLATKPPEET